MLVLVASFQDKLVKPVSEHQTILGLAAAWDDKGGSGDNRNSKTVKAPVKSPPPKYQH